MIPVPSKKRKKAEAHSIVRRVADAIRRDALQLTEGQLLGSEDELILRYSVSRPTLRQAADLDYRLTVLADCASDLLRASVAVASSCAGAVHAGAPSDMF